MRRRWRCQGGFIPLSNRAQLPGPQSVTLRPDGQESVSYAGYRGFDSRRSDLGVWLNLVRALGSGPRDWRFESAHPDGSRLPAVGARQACLASYCTTTQLATRAVLHTVFAGGGTLVVHRIADVAQRQRQPLQKRHSGGSNPLVGMFAQVAQLAEATD